MFILQLGTLVMNLSERVERNKEEVLAERSNAESKEVEKSKILKQLGELQDVQSRSAEELVKEKGKVVSLEEKLSSAEMAFKEEVKTVSSLRSEVEGLKEELKKEKESCMQASAALEKLEKDAAITYKDAVEKYQKSEEFEELVNLKAGNYHEEGFNDCIAFVGVGNAVDPAVHNVQNYRAMALAGLEGQGGDAGQ